MKKTDDDRWFEAFEALPEKKAPGGLFPSIAKQYKDWKAWNSVFRSLPDKKSPLEFDRIRSGGNAKVKKMGVWYFRMIASSLALLLSAGLYFSLGETTDNIAITVDSSTEYLDLDLLPSDPSQLCMDLNIRCDFIADEDFLRDWEELTNAVNTLAHSVGNHPIDPFWVDEMIRIENMRVELFNEFLSDLRI
ncbi:MAG: hypothetical protein EA411_01040 [Saprospirales bacterium]|nr:MAG: hypothetical protein EA411_01040 [Saprospirales bacterium]